MTAENAHDDGAAAKIEVVPSPQFAWAFKAASFEPVHCIPRKDKDVILGLTVLEANAVAHEPLADGGNHWTFYLTACSNSLHPDDRTFLQLDSTPSGVPAAGDYKGSKANIVISLLEDQRFSRAQCISKLTTRDSLTVGEMLKAITDHGREKYNFDHNGRGCKKWTSDQIALFLELGIFTDAEETRKAKDDMMFQWENFEKVCSHVEWVPGAYYQ